MTKPLFLRVAHNGWGGAAGGNVTVTIAINEGETVEVAVSQQWSSGAGQSGLVVGTITGHGTFTQRGATIDRTSGTNHWTTQKWTTDPGGGANAASITIPLTGDGNCVSVTVRCYAKVCAIGTTANTTGSTANPSLALTTTDRDSVVSTTFAHGADGPSTKLLGDLRDTSLQTGAQDVGVSEVEATAELLMPVGAAVTLGVSEWAALALEYQGFPDPDEACPPKPPFLVTRW